MKTRAGKQLQAIKNEQQMIIVLDLFQSYLMIWIVSHVSPIKYYITLQYINMALRNNILMGGYKQQNFV